MNVSIPSLIQQAIERFQKRDWATAEVLLQEILQVEPDNFAALHVMGITYVIQEKYHDAVCLLQQAVDVNPENGLAHYNLAIALSASGQDEMALPHHAQSVELSPENPDAWVNYGKSLASLKRHDEAARCYERAIALYPEHAVALSNLGALLAEAGRHEEALPYFEKVMDIDASHPSVWLNIANTLRSLKRFEEALEYYERALELDPDYAESWSSMANALCNMKRFDEALANYDRALKLAPDNADVWFNKGYTLSSLKRYDEALAYYDKSIQLAPRKADVWYIKANMLTELKRYSEAIAHFDRALELQDDRDFLYGDRLSAKMSVCDWRDIESQCVELVRRIDAGQKACTPFTALSVLDAPAVHRMVSCQYASHFPADHSLGAVFKPPMREKIRIGYFTKDFHEHATAFLTAEIFELHDREKFEVIAFSFGPQKPDAMRARLVKAFDQFVDVREKSDKEIAQLAREMGIDIAVDLQGYQTEHRPGIFASRAAPIQVNYLAYPGTMGVEYMNYLIADPMLIPSEDRHFFSEKIAYLPHSYQPNDRQRAISDRVPTRAEWNLPENGFVFCCFNNLYKITPRVFDGWMRILKQVDGSVLWLLEDTPVAMDNLRREAEQRGVSGDRLIFAKFVNQADHLARHRVADLFLDTLPYNAHTTASDALWAGLPVLTCMGKAFQSRVAASLLNAVEMPELITRSPAEFEREAIELATQPGKLAAIRQKLAKNRTTAPLFDTPRYTRYLEAAYAAMYQRYQSNLPPDHIVVTP